MLENEIRINSPRFDNITQAFDRSFHSVAFILLNVIIAVLGFSFDAFRIPSLFILAFIISLNLAVCRDVMPAFLPMVLITLVPMNSANLPLGEYVVLCYALIYVVPAIIARFLLFPIRFIKGKNFIPLSVFSIAIIFGGLGSDITAGEYFSFYPVYTMLGLGFMQLLAYLFWQNYIPDDHGKNVDYFCKMMLALSLASVCFVAVQYLRAIPHFKENGFELLWYAWKNYIADIFLLALPFGFYFVVKRKHKIPYLLFAILQYATIFVTQSAGGILFSTLMMPFLLIYTLYKVDKKEKIKVGVTLLVLIIPVVVLLGVKFDYIVELFQSKINTGGSGRLELYEVAVRVFKQFPIFGGGFGHVDDVVIRPEFIMFYYHSTLFQFLGAAGIVGVLAYAFMALYRLKTYCKRYTFNIFLLIGFLGFAGYSMIDVGTSIPFPFVMICTFMLVLCEKHTHFKTFGVIGKENYYKTEYQRIADR